MRAFYRPDLHDELKRICLLQSKEWKTPILRLGSEVVSIVCVVPIIVMQQLTIIRTSTMH